MKFHTLPLSSAYLIEVEALEDNRGFFGRTFCRETLKTRGLNPHIEQCNISFNHKKGTLRGMHYQAAPYEEAKYVSCISGSLYDVLVDLRPLSPTFLQWHAVELSEKDNTILYVPEGFAHGFQTLEDNTKVFYQISQAYAPQFAQGIRWDDPALSIKWPFTKDLIISTKDLNYPDFTHEKNPCYRC